MSTNNATPGVSAHTVQGSRPTSPGRAGSKADHYEATHSNPKCSPTYELANSKIRLELYKEGIFARIIKPELPKTQEYAGPLPQETLTALAEVAIDGC